MVRNRDVYGIDTTVAHLPEYFLGPIRVLKIVDDQHGFGPGFG